jgi:ABC-type transporter Mla subunit MlaD
LILTCEFTLNIGGEALKFLFGIATTQQLQELHDTVEGMKDREGDIIHAVQQQITYLKSVDEEVSQNAVGLARVARILKRVIIQALIRQKTWNDTVQNLEKLVDYQSNISRTMRELEFMVIQLQQSILRLQEGLDTSATGRLSSVLIPPHNLSKILQEVIFKLPPDVSLVAGFTIENMYVYYEVAKVQAN